MWGQRKTEAGPADPDQALMLDVRRGHLSSYTVLIAKYQNPLVNFFRRLGVYSDAEDLVQETFLRIYRHRRRYRPSAKFTTFLYAVARSVWVDAYRKSVRRQAFHARYEQEMRDGASRGGPSAGAQLDVREAVDALPRKLREVVVLSVFQGLPYQEIAKVLGIPEGTVKSRMHLAMAQLKEHMHVADEARQSRA